MKTETVTIHKSIRATQRSLLISMIFEEQKGNKSNEIGIQSKGRTERESQSRVPTAQEGPREGQ